MRKKWIWKLAILILLAGSITVFALTQQNVSTTMSDETEQPTATTNSCCGPATVSKTTTGSIGGCCGSTPQKVQRSATSQQATRPVVPIARKTGPQTARGCGCGSR